MWNDHFVLPKSRMLSPRRMLRPQAEHIAQEWEFNDKCRIPDDCINEKLYPLFMACAVLKELIKLLQSTGSVSS